MNSLPTAKVLDRPNLDDSFRHFDRLCAVSRFTSLFAHEFGGPLNVIQGRAWLMVSGEVPESDMLRNARIIADQCERMAEVLRRLVARSSREPPRVSDVDLSMLVRRAVAFLASTSDGKRAPIRVEEPEAPAMVSADAERLLVAIVDLLRNGIQAGPSESTVVVRIRAESIGNGYRLDVVDSGEGISEAVLPNLFQPFVTTKSGREGAGLGLFIAQGIAKESGGWIEAQNNPGQGACFTLHLPRGARDGS